MEQCLSLAGPHDSAAMSLLTIPSRWSFAILPVLLFAALAAPAGAQSLIVVDAALGPGADHATINAAVQAASDGDTLLVRPGAYNEAFTLDGLALTIIADGPAGSVIVLNANVRNLAANEQVTLRGLTAAPFFFSLLPASSIKNCDGAIHIEDCTFLSAPTNPLGNVLIDDARAVTMSRCTIVPGFGTTASEAGLVVLESNLALFDSTVTGTDGTQSVVGPTVGNAAIRAVGSRISVSGSTLTGGDGGDGLPHFGPCQDGADGGHALEMVASGAGDVEIIDSALVGGAAGASGGSGCTAGTPGFGVATLPGAGTVVQRPGSAPQFTLTSPLRSGDLLQFELLGPPNAPVSLLLGLEPGPIAPVDPLLTGVATVGAPLLVLPYFPIPGDGDFDQSDAPGTVVLPPGLSHLHLYFQHVVVDPTVGLIASTPSVLTILAPGF